MDKPVLVKDNKCWADVLTLAFVKNSDCILGGRKLVAYAFSITNLLMILTYFLSIEVMGDKIKTWDEVFFPLDFSHVCDRNDMSRLPEDVFGRIKQKQDMTESQDQARQSRLFSS